MNYVYIRKKVLVNMWLNISCYAENMRNDKYYVLKVNMLTKNWEFSCFETGNSAKGLAHLPTKLSAVSDMTLNNQGANTCTSNVKLHDCMYTIQGPWNISTEIFQLFFWLSRCHMAQI